MKYEQFKDDELYLRDRLAIDRTAMANERTFLAYGRTAILVGATAVTLYKLFPNNVWLSTIASTLVPIAFFISVAGIRRYFVLAKSLKKFER